MPTIEELETEVARLRAILDRVEQLPHSWARDLDTFKGQEHADHMMRAYDVVELATNAFTEELRAALYGPRPQ